MMSHPELEFFNSLTGRLKIKLTVPAQPDGKMLNLRALPEAKIESLEFSVEVFNPESEVFRELTAEELNGIAFYGNHIGLRGESGEMVHHDAPNGRFFTVRQLLQAVEETERKTRDQTDWLGGIDVHHCYFEGIEPNDDGGWDICWGS